MLTINSITSRDDDDGHVLVFNFKCDDQEFDPTVSTFWIASGLDNRALANRIIHIAESILALE